MPKLPTGFQHALILSEREELCVVERHSLRQLGLPFIQHLSDGSKALELIQKNNAVSRRGQMPSRNRSSGRLSGRSAAPFFQSSERAGALLLSPGDPSGLARLPVDLLLCTERLEDSHALPFIEKLRGMPEQANIALLMFPDSTRLWREAEKLGACCLSRPYTLHDLQAALLKARHLAQKSFVFYSQALNQPSGTSAAANLSGSTLSRDPQARDAAARTGQGGAAATVSPATLSAVDYGNEGLGLAKPEPPKREPFPLVDDDDDFYEVEFVKREPFPLVDDDDEMAVYFSRPKREPFPLVDDVEFPARHISGVSAEPADFAWPKTGPQTTPEISYSASRSRYSSAPDRQPVNVAGESAVSVNQSNLENQVASESRNLALEQAEYLLSQGYHINAAQAFLNVPQYVLRGKSLHYIIARSCQFTAAPENNLRAMCRAMDIIGHPALSSMLERDLLRMYGSDVEPKVNPLFKAFPLLEDVLSVAQMTFSAWREPGAGEGLVELG